jgi:hypothetical protein
MATEYSAQTKLWVATMMPNIRFLPKLKITVLVDHYSKRSSQNFSNNNEQQRSY